MPQYDETLEAQFEELRRLAAERITVERDYRRGSQDEDTASFYNSALIELEERLEAVVNLLRALLFDDVEETQQQYEERRKAYVEYGTKFLFQSRRGSFRLGDFLPNGPVQSFRERMARHSAAESRESRLRDSLNE